MIHFHRYQWGEVETEAWYKVVSGRATLWNPTQYDFKRMVQIGKCSCGKAKKRYLS